MSFHDLNVAWSPSSNAQLPRTLAFLSELGYNAVALNHSMTGKLPADLTCPIPSTLQTPPPPNLQVLRRCTLTLTTAHQNARLATLASNYDLLALRPIDEKTLSLACTSLDCDIISLDLTQRLPFWFKFKMLAEATKSGKKIEISYAPGIAAGDAGARRNLISNATQLIRATRGGRGIILSSGASSALGCRGPWDVINLAAVWGLSQERGYEAMGKECRNCVASAALKRTSWRGVVDVVYGGEKPAVEERKGPEEERVKGKGKGKQGDGQKRKAGEMESENAGGDSTAGAEKAPMSKRQMKKQAKEERRLQNGADTSQANDTPGKANSKT